MTVSIAGNCRLATSFANHFIGQMLSDVLLIQQLLVKLN